ncbi:MAG TPA: hypothetical protein VFJ91_04160 [Gaiellaceae bacterium]|nr:hypothetical protein [Gaiellaceae bacterium]
MSQLGFLSGALVGALSYAVHSSVVLSVFVFGLLWYAVSYGVVRIVEHEDRRNAWVVHVTLVPAVAIVGAVAAEQAWPGQMFGACLVGFVGGVLVQAAVTHLALRGVVDDMRHDLRRRLGLE